MAESTDNRYRNTLDSLLEGFQIIGPDWTYLYVNPAAATQGHSTPGALMGRKMFDVYPGFETTELFPILERCMRDRVETTLENLFTYPDGSRGWFELRIEPVPQGLCIYSVDIDARKTAEAAINRLNAELEDRVLARTRELKDVNAELESFAHAISHDLRAPLRHVNGFATLLAEDAAPRLTPADQASLRRIIAATERLTGMVDALLTFSRLGTTPLEKRPVDLREIVEGAKSDVAPDVEGREVAWSVGELPRVHADPALMRMAIVNLLSNAIKYTRGRSPAQIAIGANEGPLAGEHILWVRDNGVGFDMSSARNLFGVFQRLHRPEEFEGTGIGLANVRRIVARHGGRTWADSSVGSGATFFLSFPPVAPSGTFPD